IKYVWNVVVEENQERVARLEIYMKRADSSKARWSTWLRCSRNCYLLHSAAQSHLNCVRVILRRSLRSRQVNAATFRHCARVDEVESLLLDSPFEQPPS